MTKKTELRHIGMIMLVMCTALIMTVLPAAATYTADKPLTEYEKGTVTGGMNYTIGDSYYSPKMWSNDTYVYSVTLPNGIPNGSTVHKLRLYVYWTWSFNDTNPSSGAYDTSVNATMNVDFNGNVFNEPNASYVDLKYDNLLNTDDGYYNYPSGTYAYDIPSDCFNDSYTVNITNTYGSAYNQSFNIQTVGLFTLYNDGDNDVYHYWIDEGCDMTYVRWKDGAWKDGIAPSDAMCRANFSNQGNFDAESASLITAVPSAGTIYNKLNFSGQNDWYSVWPGSPAPLSGNFAWNTTDVTSEFQEIDNYALICNGWDDNTTGTDGQMQAANAFLLVKEM